jgi:hypothetical protein
MKKSLVCFNVRCKECQKVEVENRDPVGLLQPFPIPEWKWEIVTIDFITKLPRIARKHDSIIVVVEKLTKAVYFIPVKMTHKATNIAVIYMKEISRLHGVPKEIVSHRDTTVTSNFWKRLYEGFGTNLNFSTTYHPKSNGKTDRVNQIIEDMLIMCVMDQPSKWEDYLHLVEFTYKNGYQTSLKMSPF